MSDGIPFTQYKLPHGSRVEVTAQRPADIEALAHAFIARGGKFECEVLTTGQVSLTACAPVDGEMQDIAIRVCANGQTVGDNTDDLVREAAKWAAS